MLVFPLASQRADVWCAWRGPALLVVGGDGTVGGALTGFYFRQTRYLSRLDVRVNGDAPYPCSIAETATNRLEATYIHPEVRRGGGGGSGSGGGGEWNGVPYRAIDIRLVCEVHAASVTVSFTVANRCARAIDVEVAVDAAADFALIDEVQFDELPTVDVSSTRAQALRFCGTRAGSRLATIIEPETTSWSLRDRGLHAHLHLAPQETYELSLRVTAHDETDPITLEGEAQREQRLAQWREELTGIQVAAEPPIAEYATRALHDVGGFALLEGAADEWLTPAAGAPLYLALWGRDALTTSWQTGLFDRGDMLRDVVTALGRMQGRTRDDARDELPGRIINQSKKDPLSRGGETPFARAYQDVASPFMYIIGLGYHYTLTNDKEFLRRYWPHACAILEWADHDGDLDGDGYIEYLTRAPRGPSHQGWKDSENAVVRADGSQVAPPVAASEIQGYWYVALQFMAVLSGVLGEVTRAAELWGRAADLRERFNRDFWLEDEGCIAFGLDAHKEPIRSVTSNAAHCLPTGIVDREHTARLVRRIFEPDLFSGWGIRTLSTANPAYNPLDYHLGAVWPVENASILFGLRRYGFAERVVQLARALYDLARLWPGGRVPECVGGYDRAELAHPGAYPRANRPQAWNQSVWPIMLQSLLGLVPCAPLRLLLVDPLLPPWLPELVLRRVRVGDASVDLHFRRAEDGSAQCDVLETRGRVRVIRQPWLESYSTTMFERISDLMRSPAHR